MSFESTYKGLRVIDLSQGVAGPYCAMMLAQHGADVIKVEPHEGDWARGLGKAYGDMTAFAVAGNLGKRAIALDLKTTEGYEIVDRLVREADVFIEGFRPGVIDKLGFSYERLSQRDPELIYVSISGFGQRGPLAKKPAMDPVLQAFVGSLEENKGMDGIPHRTPNVFFDMSCAMYALHSVSAALHLKRDGQGGRRVEVSLMQAAANITSVRLQSNVCDGPYNPVAAPSGTFKTSDGWIQMVAVKDNEFRKACKALGLDDILVDPRFQTSVNRGEHQAYINGRAADIIAQKTSAEWNRILTEGDVQNEIVQTYRDFVRHPHTEATGLVSWLPQEGPEGLWPVPNPPNLPKLEAGNPRGVVPVRGQHSRDILAEFGFSGEEIEALIEKGVVLAAR